MSGLPTALTSDSGVGLAAGKFQQRLIGRLTYVTDKTGQNLIKYPERYKRYFDRKVRFSLTVMADDLVFVYKPPPSAKTQAEQL